MDRSKIIEILCINGISVVDEKRLANNTGVQLKLNNESVVNIYDKGTYYIQGKNSARTKEILSATDIEPQNNQAQYKNVFVVYGHDSISRTQLEAMLRRWELEPLIIDQLPSEGQTIIEKLESYTAKVHFAVVLATPDDEGYRSGRPDEKQFRARQNVVLELGMLLSRLRRNRVAILLKDQTSMERPSDIQGLIYIPFRDSIDEARISLCKELKKAGYCISIERL